MQLYKVDAPHLKDPALTQRIPRILSGDEDIFDLLKKRDVLLYHPYDSFLPVEKFIRQAARDPQVIAIKQTLYRAGPNSPIVAALMEARNAGKQVAALVELKARFDEENNIVWARALEKTGVHVVYGLLGLKTHAKMCLVVRREEDGVRMYGHLGTGNYNPVTARIYTDLGLLTSDQQITADISELFNSITGYSQQSNFRKIIAAPHNMRSEIIRRIDREIDHHKKMGKGHLYFKMNSLVDKECVKALYRASQAGVKVELNIRGICVLRPGIPRVSENITVTSIVGRFLEHARIYYFHNGGEEEIFCGSADLMPRNLDRRVEVLFPIEDRQIFDTLRNDILFFQSQDNVQARRLDREGNYQSLSLDDPLKALDTQNVLAESTSSWWLE